MATAVAQDAIKQPSHPDGQKWLVIWVAPDGRAIFADSISEIVSHIVPGYEELDDSDPSQDAHLEARVATLAKLAGDAQAHIVTDEGLENFTEDELTAMLTPKELIVDIDSWNPATPLLLLTTNYAPFTKHPAPEGAVVWLDPISEVTFLSGLQNLGFGELWVTGH